MSLLSGGSISLDSTFNWSVETFLNKKKSCIKGGKRKRE